MSIFEPVQAHEYWLDPVGSGWQVGDTLLADIRNGEHFTGTTFPFNPDALHRAGLISATKRQPLAGRLGDYPAFQIPVMEAGINLLLLETTRRELLYEDAAAFKTFLDYHALGEILAQHHARGLPVTGITEHYYRFCKALVTVESAAMSDSTTAPRSDAAREAGTAQTPMVTDDSSGGIGEPVAALQPQDQGFELVALRNPFSSGEVQLQLLLEGKPLASRQIELFHRDGLNTVTRTTQNSDINGIVQFDVSSAGDYLVNSVWIEPASDGTAHWTTLWASLYFERTDQHEP